MNNQSQPKQTNPASDIDLDDSMLALDIDDNLLPSINPTQESKQNTTLEYSDEVHGDKNAIADELFWRYVKDAIDAAIDRQQLDEAKNIAYLTYLAWRTNDTSLSVPERQKWADAFTDMSIEIWGKPDPVLAKKFEESAQQKIIDDYSDIFDSVRGYLTTEYSYAFDALDIGGKTTPMTSEEIVETFQRGLDALKVKDQRWEEWKVVRADSDVITVNGKKKQIRVGKNRTDVEPRSVGGLFAHEFLRHALTKINSLEIGITEPLPHYLASEEGYAIINEVAISGKFPEKIVDRYVDIAYVLGDLTGQTHTRSELINRYIYRAQSRNTYRSDEEVLVAAYTHANRIFRGTPGDEEVSGVFTKDQVYLAGLIPSLEFIRQELNRGAKIDSIMRFIMAAKFDTSSPTQREIVREKLVEHYGLSKKPPRKAALIDAQKESVSI